MAVIDQSLIVADTLVVGRVDATAGKRCNSKSAPNLCVWRMCIRKQYSINWGPQFIPSWGAWLAVARGSHGPDGDYIAHAPRKRMGPGSRHGDGA